MNSRIPRNDHVITWSELLAICKLDNAATRISPKPTVSASPVFLTGDMESPEPRSRDHFDTNSFSDTPQTNNSVSPKRDTKSEERATSERSRDIHNRAEMKPATAGASAVNLTPREAATKLFEEIDKNGDGIVTHIELVKALRGNDRLAKVCTDLIIEYYKIFL